MNKKSSGRKRTTPLISNHQRSWLWGRHLVEEILQAGTWPICELYLADDAPEVLRALAETRGSQGNFVVQITTRERISQLSPNPDHQGCLARMGPFPYRTLEELLQTRLTQEIWLIAVGIQDSHNLGAILRSAEVFGVHGVLLESRNQVSVNSQVARSSAGAVNRLGIAQVADSVQAISQLQANGVRVYATTLDATVILPELPLTGQVGLVLGNESTGVPQAIVDQCDGRLRIPQIGTLNSLNVAAAAAICLYEVQRQSHSTR